MEEDPSLDGIVVTHGTATLEETAYFLNLASKVDIPIVLVGEAPEGFDTTGDALFNRPWTTIGIPCITIPNTTGHNGLPVGIQLISGYGTDENLISVADWVEGALRS